MSSISTIATVTNYTPDVVVFVNTETSGNNRTITPGQTVSIGAWVPWCDSAEAFPFHHLQLTSHKNVFYIYQSGPKVFGTYYIYDDQVSRLGDTGSKLNLQIDRDFVIRVVS